MRGKRPVLRPLGEVVDLPISKVRVPDPPQHLSPRERKVWDEAAAVLVSKSVYDADCQHILISFCVMFARYLEANEMVTQLGLKDDASVKWRVISNQAHDRAMRCASELGLTPFARKRVARNRPIGGYLSGKRKAKA
jgi:P27 family predicted phage terminase small subunit